MHRARLHERCRHVPREGRAPAERHGPKQLQRFILFRQAFAKVMSGPIAKYVGQRPSRHVGLWQQFPVGKVIGAQLMMDASAKEVKEILA